MSAFALHSPTYAALLSGGFEPETVAHLARVAAAGGTGTDAAYIDRCYKKLKELGIKSNVIGWWESRFGYTTSAGVLTKLFSIDNGQRDQAPVAGHTAHTVTAVGYAGKPEITFAGSVMGRAGFPHPASAYTYLSLFRTPVSPTRGALAGYGPDGAGYLTFTYYAGFIRAFHQIDYSGTELSMKQPNNASNYDGSQLRIYSRWLAGRAAPDLVAWVNGTQAVSYSGSGSKPSLTAAQVGKTFHIGGAVENGTLNKIAAGSMSYFIVLNIETAATVAALDAFLKTEYGMSA